MSVMSSVTKAFTYQADWPEKEEFLDVIYWSRQILGLLIGCVWGLVPLKGFIGILLFGALSAGLIYVWFTAVQGRSCPSQIYLFVLYRVLQVLMKPSMAEPGS